MEKEIAAITPEDGIKQLLEGNQRFIAGKTDLTNRDARRRAEIAHGQRPFAIVVGYSDSRVGPEIVFDQGLGDIFVVRTAGEVVGEVDLGSIEYAVDHLGVSLIIVLGHNRCGAVSAAVAGEKHLAAVLDSIKPALVKAKDQPGDIFENAERSQVFEVCEQLQHSEPVLAKLVNSGRLQVVGAYYNLDTGCVEILD